MIMEIISSFQEKKGGGSQQITEFDSPNQFFPFSTLVEWRVRLPAYMYSTVLSTLLEPRGIKAARPLN